MISIRNTTMPGLKTDDESCKGLSENYRQCGRAQSLLDARSQMALWPFWGGVSHLSLHWFPDGIITNETFVIGFFLTSCQISCFALRHLRSGCRFVTHKSPLIKSRDSHRKTMRLITFPTLLFFHLSKQKYRGYL